MDTFEGNSCIIFHRNYEGDATIKDASGQEFIISCDDLLGFAAEYRRQELIIELENASWREILRAGNGPKTSSPPDDR